MERSHRLFERRLQIRTMRIENINVVEAHALETLIETCEQVLARTSFAIGTGPHEIPGLGRDNDLVTIGGEVLGEHSAKVDFC